MEDKLFIPNGLLTREQAATILDRTVQYLKINSNSNVEATYEDDDYISEWAKDSVYRMMDMKIMIGDNKCYFKPQEYCTTEEMIVAIMRVYRMV